MGAARRRRRLAVDLADGHHLRPDDRIPVARSVRRRLPGLPHAQGLAVIEEIDGLIPRILALGPDVLAITGDHSTPAILKAHSWHPVPFLLFSKWCLPDEAERFTERAARRGSLGHFHATSAMGLMLANALKLLKFGA